ncbi:hypothetical protein MBLNU230_g7197t1 [Neophaeotheca triangularis]
MGFAQLWSVVTGRRSKDAQRVDSFYEPPRHPSKQSVRLANKYHSSPTVPQVQSQPNAPQEKAAKRKSGRFSLSRSKAEALVDERPRKRRTWYGGLPGVNKDVPDVPALPQQHAKTRSNYNDSNSNISALPSAFERRQSYRRSLLTSNDNEDKAIYVGNRNFNEPSPPERRQSSVTSAGYFQRRQSVYQTNSTVLPPPGTAQTTDDFPPAQPSKEKRKSLRHSIGVALNREQSSQSITTPTSRNTKRSSWFQSSNPDTGGDEYETQPPMPSIPADIQKHPNNRPISGYYEDSTDDAAAPPPVPRRASYTPRNAAKSFLKSTTAPTADERTKMMRRSQGLEPLEASDFASGMNSEQRAQWDKLRNLLEVLEKRQDARESVSVGEESDDDESDQAGGRFANQTALRALEFGGVGEEDSEEEDRDGDVERETRGRRRTRYGEEAMEDEDIPTRQVYVRDW